MNLEERRDSSEFNLLRIHEFEHELQFLIQDSEAAQMEFWYISYAGREHNNKDDGKNWKIDCFHELQNPLIKS